MISSQPATSPVVSIIVVSYNTRDITLACLRSVVAQTKVPYELLVMDNASQDGSAEAIAAEFPDIRFFAETENHGFARANNMLAKHATGDYVLLLNPDTVVLDGAIDTLVAAAGDLPEAGIWGGRTVFGDGSLNPSSAWRKMDMWNIFCRTTGLSGLFPKSGLFNAEAYGGWDRSETRQVDVVVGCFLLIKRAFWETLGGFDLTFFMYGEEADLCLRARALGARPTLVPEACIVHYGAASETVREDKMVRLLNAKVTLVHRHFPAWQRPVALWLLALWPLSRAWAARVRGGQGAQAQSWARVWARRAEWRNGYPDISD